jgi:hypothetical protein
LVVGQICRPEASTSAKSRFASPKSTTINLGAPLIEAPLIEAPLIEAPLIEAPPRSLGFRITPSDIPDCLQAEEIFD